MSHYIAYLAKRFRLSSSLGLFLALLIFWWVLLFIFNRFPEVDLAVARGVFNPKNCGIFDGRVKTCGFFPLSENAAFMSMRAFFLKIPYIAIVVLISSIFIMRHFLGQPWKARGIELILAALISLAAGCGLLVNLILKEFGGRPRPRDTLFFGGDLDFVRAGSFAGKCIKNCSFVSGEASSAGWLLCLIVLLPQRFRLSLGLPLATISIWMAAMRVLIGAHFLSDAVLGWLSSIVIFAGVLAILGTVNKPLN